MCFHAGAVPSDDELRTILKSCRLGDVLGAQLDQKIERLSAGQVSVMVHGEAWIQALNVHLIREDSWLGP